MTDVKAVVPPKDDSPILVTLLIVRDVKYSRPLKSSLAIGPEKSNVTVLILCELKNIRLAVVGAAEVYIVTVSKFEIPENAYSPIVFTDDGIVTEANPVGYQCLLLLQMIGNLY